MSDYHIHPRRSASRRSPGPILWFAATPIKSDVPFAKRFGGTLKDVLRRGIEVQGERRRLHLQCIDFGEAPITGSEPADATACEPRAARGIAAAPQGVLSPPIKRTGTHQLLDALKARAEVSHE
jgi:hypothetical protein